MIVKRARYLTVVMSWDRFDELKTFAQRRRRSAPKLKEQGGTRASVGKRKRSLNDSLNFGARPLEGDIEGFSSGEENVLEEYPDALIRSQRKHKKSCWAKDASEPTDCIKTEDHCQGLSHPITHMNQEELRKRRRLHITDVTQRNTVNEDIAWSASDSDELEDENAYNMGTDTGSIPLDSKTPDSQAQSNLEQQSRSTVEGISDFGSSDSEVSVEEVMDIMTPTPSTTATPCNPTPRGIPKRGSEWIRQVQQTSQDRKQLLSPDQGDTLLAFDSAKKKNKYTRCGFAEQLQRLINREKSEKAFWAHRMGDLQKEENGQLQESKSAVTVRLLSCDTRYALQVSRCRVLSHCEQNALPQFVDVMFDCVTMRRLQLGTGSVIRIHPPWQKLEVPSSPYPVFLCVYFCEKLPTPPGSPSADIPTSTDSVVSIPGYLSFLPCPTVRSPVKTFRPTKLRFGGSDIASCVNPSVDGFSASRLTAVRSEPLPANETPPKGSILEAVQSQGGCSGASVSFHATVQRVYCTRKKSTRPPVGEGSFLMSRSLKSNAQTAAKVEEVRWTLLVQDEHKAFGEIRISPHLLSIPSWNEVVVAGEGNHFTFQQLRVSQRTNRSRCPGLFGLIDSLWTVEEKRKIHRESSSQIATPEDESPSVVDTEPQSFCYVLVVQELSKVIPCRCMAAILYKTVECRTLRDILYSRTNTPLRVSLCCRLLYAHNLVKDDTPSRHDTGSGFTLFVTDSSLQDASVPWRSGRHDDSVGDISMIYLKVEGLSSSVLPDAVKENLDKPASLLFLKDLCITMKDEFKVCADEYSVIKKGIQSSSESPKLDVAAVPAEELTRLGKISLPPLLLQTTAGSLCRVEGTITGVNEESACCWLVCDTCENSDITGGYHGSPYYCDVCSRAVTSPKTKTYLEVFVRTRSVPSAHVQLKLLQSSIESLLPVSYQDNEEGYDIELVLGKQLGLLDCYVEHCSVKKGEELHTTTFKLKQIFTL